VTVVDCMFRHNRAAQYGSDVAGGVIYGIGAGGTTIVRCTFEDNAVANGGWMEILNNAVAPVTLPTEAASAFYRIAGQ